jgi:glycosyltransferase involved in cell wall biosynthesis
MRKVLLIAYPFPPRNSSGVFRPTKFVKYLPQFGWQPSVITTDHNRTGEEGIDETLLADIPLDVEVWRVPTPRPRPVEWLQSLVGWKSKSTAISDQNADMTSTAIHATPNRPSLIKMIRRTLLSPFYLIQQPPIDNLLYWSLCIVPLALYIIKQKQIDVIITTSPPWSPLLSGLLLKLLTRKPWVVDIRDPWTTDHFIYHSTGFWHRFNQWLERRILRYADHTILASKAWMPFYSKFYKSPHSRLTEITNGYDSEDFDVNEQEQNKTSDTSFVQIFYPGSVHSEEIDPIINSLKQLPRHIRERLKFHFVGYMHPNQIRRIQESSIKHLFSRYPVRISHVEALEKMTQSQILLLLRSNPDYYPGKLFEYMRVGRPILAILPPGVASELVIKSGIGCVITPNANEKLAKVLEQIATDYPGFLAKHYHPNWDIINRYDRQKLTGQLVQILEKVTLSNEKDL